MLPQKRLHFREAEPAHAQATLALDREQTGLTERHLPPNLNSPKSRPIPSLRAPPPEIERCSTEPELSHNDSERHALRTSSRRVLQNSRLQSLRVPSATSPATCLQNFRLQLLEIRLRHAPILGSPAHVTRRASARMYFFLTL